MIKLVLSDPHNYYKDRQGHRINRIFFHRTAVRGDTAIGEGKYFASHNVGASAHYFIDLAGNIVQSVPDHATAYAVAQLDENFGSISIEFTGLNDTPLTQSQIKSAISLIRGNAFLKSVQPHRLAISEITPRIVSGYANHADVTTAYSISGGHTDKISEAEIETILKGVAA
jgi:N-acetyl-anhydromuramyl-L-alanine amidase AmpD